MDGFVSVDTYNKLYEEHELLKRRLEKVLVDREWWKGKCLEMCTDCCAIIEKLEETKARMDLIANKW